MFAAAFVVIVFFVAIAFVLVLFKRSSITVYKVLFIVSFFLNFALGFGLIIYMVKDSYDAPAYKTMKQAFADLALVFPKNTKKEEIIKTWSQAVVNYPDGDHIGIRVGEVIFYFNDDGSIKAIRSSYKPWLKDYDNPQK